jgi:hypothetical protein
MVSYQPDSHDRSVSGRTPPRGVSDLDPALNDV